MEVKIENIDAAYMLCVKLLKEKGFKILETNPINNNRYLICKTDRCKFLVTYKRDFFHNFGRIFRQQGAYGMGESVNIDTLKYCIQSNIKNLMFIYPNSHVYIITVDEFLRNSFKREVKEGKITRSISIHKLKRFDY